MGNFANIFVGESGLLIGTANSAPLAASTTMFTNNNTHLTSSSRAGLETTVLVDVTPSTDVTTGQIVGMDPNILPQDPGKGGPAVIFATAGTYTISVRYLYNDNAPGQQIFASNRRLWVAAIGF